MAGFNAFPDVHENPALVRLTGVQTSCAGIRKKPTLKLKSRYIASESGLFFWRGIYRNITYCLTAFTLSVCPSLSIYLPETSVSQSPFL